MLFETILETVVLFKFTEYSELPVIEANINNIYEVLKKVVTDKAFREEKGARLRAFAKKHFSPKEIRSNSLNS